MTRKDFELIASTLKAEADRLQSRMDIVQSREGRVAVELLIAQHITTANALASALWGTNPRFDRERFLRACGVGA